MRTELCRRATLGLFAFCADVDGSESPREQQTTVRQLGVAWEDTRQKEYSK